MKTCRTDACLFLTLLLGLPLLGAWLGGKPVSDYLDFPPRAMSVQHEPFSWPVFLGLALVILLTIGPIVLRVWSANFRSSSLLPQSPSFAPQHSPLTTQHFVLPWWGWLGMGWTALWWLLAWTRFPWMAPLQEHTFTPLWLGYVVVVNAWTCARTGHCMMRDRPRYFLSLFPLSVLLWWLFEYLNRFSQNWFYAGVADLSSLEYFVRGSIPFSTVLPAVLGTAELLTSYPRLSAGLERCEALKIHRPELVGWSLAILSSVGLVGIGLWPDYLFPLVWVGPLSLLVSLQLLAGRPTIFSPLAQGDWRGLWVAALAALMCGFWWELWNAKSLAHWQYAIPFVERFRLFEMPILGYAGYLPFGLECLAFADFCLSRKFSAGVNYYAERQAGGPI
ncbi:MAG TPA: hypothetical protein VJ746_18610 [Nitrospira sp.]|nr:hypothetical protein [Nitrospira sp.]